MLGIVAGSARFEARDAGIVDQNVESAMRGNDLLEDALPVRLVTDVKMRVVRRRSQRGGGRLPRRVIDIGQPDRCALGREGGGNRQPDAARSTRHKRCLPL